MDELFTVGTQLYYPVHGVAELASIGERDGVTFYVLSFVATGLKITVSAENVVAVGVRVLVSDEDIADVYEILQSKDGGSDSQTWNRRQREYMDKIKTGSPFEIAEVLRDLCLLRENKTLSSGERSILDKAQKLLVKEISCAQDKAEADIKDHIEGFYRSKAA